MLQFYIAGIWEIGALQSPVGFTQDGNLQKQKDARLINKAVETLQSLESDMS
jgi:hypothetical protein